MNKDSESKNLLNKQNEHTTSDKMLLIANDYQTQSGPETFTRHPQRRSLESAMPLLHSKKGSRDDSTKSLGEGNVPQQRCAHGLMETIPEKSGRLSWTRPRLSDPSISAIDVFGETLDSLDVWAEKDVFSSQKGRRSSDKRSSWSSSRGETSSTSTHSSRQESISIYSDSSFSTWEGR